MRTRLEILLYCENLCEFHDFVAIRESFLRKILGVVFIGAEKASNLRKFSPQKSYLIAAAIVSKAEIIQQQTKN